MKFKTKVIAILLAAFFSLNYTSVSASTINTSQLSEPIFCTQDPDPNMPDIIAEGAVLLDLDTAKVMYSHNMNDKFYPASTTKILTALLAIEYGDLDDIVIVSEEANLVERDGTIAGLDLHEEIELEKLIYGLMLPSGNDAAYTIAVYVSRKVTGDPDMPMQEALEYFNDLMNKRAKDAGAKNSHFSNPHGYHSDDHYTTPYDIAMIAREAMQYDFFRKVISTRMYTMEDWNGFDKDDPTKKEIRYWKNTNRLIDDRDTQFYYPYATGIKTGYTSNAGQCLVSSAQKGSLHLISVVYKCNSREGKWTDSTELFEFGFETFTSKVIAQKGEIIDIANVANHSSDDNGVVGLIAKEGFKTVIKKSDIDKLQKKILAQPDIQAPLKKGQVLGQVSYEIDGTTIFKTDLIASRDIKEKTLLNPNIINNNSDSNSPKLQFKNIKDILIVCIIVGLFLVVLINILKRRRKKQHIFFKR